MITLPYLHRFVSIVLMAGLLVVTSSALASDEVKATAGQTYYTLFSFFYEGDHHMTTNYRKGTLVPINTPVKFIESDDEEIVISAWEKEISIVNVSGFSGEDIEGIFNRMFGSTPINLDKFTSQERENILAGTVVKGMGKDAVIRAIGYPPKHRTPSLSAPEWRYWHNRVNSFLVCFSDGKVTGIKE